MSLLNNLQFLIKILIKVLQFSSVATLIINQPFIELLVFHVHSQLLEFVWGEQRIINTQIIITLLINRNVFEIILLNKTRTLLNFIVYNMMITK